MDEISFQIAPSAETNDHEVRIMVNGQSIIPDGLMGLDPVDLFEQEALKKSGVLTFARCACGVIGCDHDVVEISRESDTVTWQRRKSLNLAYIFEKHQYDDAVQNLTTDFNWETPERTAERLIRDLDFKGLSEYGLQFRWASGRMNNRKISVCFDFDKETKSQVICHAPWDHLNPFDAVEAVQMVLEIPPLDWPDVVYHPQGKPKKAPIIAGPGWSEGR